MSENIKWNHHVIPQIKYYIDQGYSRRKMAVSLHENFDYFRRFEVKRIKRSIEWLFSESEFSNQLKEYREKNEGKAFKEVIEDDFSDALYTKQETNNLIYHRIKELQAEYEISPPEERDDILDRIAKLQKRLEEGTGVASVLRIKEKIAVKKESGGPSGNEVPRVKRADVKLLE